MLSPLGRGRNQKVHELAHPSPWGQQPLARPIPSVLLMAGGRRSHKRLGSPAEPGALR